MIIEEEFFTLNFDESQHIIKISGSLRLNGLDEYGRILEVLRSCLEETDHMVIDLTELQFLNSSGIAMLSKFTIEARNRENLALEIIGSSSIPWQGKSLKNLQRLFPSLTLTIK